MSHIVPYPTQGGERLRAAGLIRLLSQLGSVQAVIGQDATLVLPDTEQLPRVQFHPFDFQRHMRPVWRYFVANRALVRHLRRILQKFPIDIAVIDYQFYGKYIAFFQQAGIPVIYGTHNAEALMAKQEMTRYRGAKACEKWLLYHLQACHERLYFPQAEGFMVVSAEDARYYARWVEASRILILPNFIDPEHYPQRAKISPVVNTRKLVMTANFTVFQNRDGVFWFIQEVWQTFRLFETFDLWLVGRGSAEILTELRQTFPELEHIQATGVVPTLSPVIEDACAAVVPLLHGSGTRLKILEAMWHRLPVISTTLGATGIEGRAGQHFLLADTPSEFVQCLREVTQPLRRQQLVAQSETLIKTHYLLAPNQTRLTEFIQQRIWQHRP